MAVKLDDIVHLEATSLVPEIPLYVADHILSLWQELKCEDPPFWAFAWTGGQALARWTLDNHETFRGKEVLDIGSGTGLNSIAAKLCGARVTSVDNNDYSRQLTQFNADFHGVSLDIEEEIPESFEGIDIVLFGDTFYEFDLAQFVIRTIDAALTEECTVYAGDPKREYLPLRRCRQLARYTVPDTMHLERRPATPSYVFEIVGNGPITS